MDIAKLTIEKLAQTDIKDQRELASVLRTIYSQHHIDPMPKSQLIAAYQQMIINKEIEPNKKLEKLLIKRAVRTLSGVTVITVLTKPFVCPGKCVYCPTEPNMPKSYLSNEPAAQRAVRNKFDPFTQMQMRIKALQNNGHQVDKIEAIILGGTWSAYDRDYQEWFITQLFYGANTYPESVNRNPESGQRTTDNGIRPTGTLSEEQKINETAKYRIIGLTLETRPDHVDEEEVKWFRYLGCTRVQLGVQHTDNKILAYIRRGDTVENAIKATRLFKEAGFKVDHHYMPDLPGSTPAKDLAVFQEVYYGEDLCPDQVKIYPCIVNEYSQLWHWFKNGKYKPYDEKDLLQLLLEIKKITPPYVRINRLIRDIPNESIIAGNKITNLRQYLQEELKKQGKNCVCIRCREVRDNTESITKAELKIRHYRASQGDEYFLSYESPDEKQLYAFLRLRFNDNPTENFIDELKGASLVRELHVYGKMIPVNDDADSEAQHIGFGRRLMAEAERLTKEKGLTKVAVISGIGVREYYRKLGYHDEGTYVVKYLT